jgi:hypothetical protein
VRALDGRRPPPEFSTVTTPKPGDGRFKPVKGAEPRLAARIDFSSSNRAVMASRLNGKPATRKHGKPTRG